jgi:hypothetical protein
VFKLTNILSDNAGVKRREKGALRNAYSFLPPIPNPRLRSRPTDATPTVIVVAIAVDVRRVVTVREACVRGIVVPIATAKASTLYCYPFFLS